MVVEKSFAKGNFINNSYRNPHSIATSPTNRPMWNNVLGTSQNADGYPYSRYSQSNKSVIYRCSHCKNAKCRIDLTDGAFEVYGKHNENCRKLEKIVPLVDIGF